MKIELMRDLRKIAYAPEVSFRYLIMPRSRVMAAETSNGGLEPEVMVKVTLTKKALSS